MIDECFHRRVEPIFFGKLQRKTLIHRARHHSGRFERLATFQHFQNMFLSRAEAICKFARNRAAIADLICIFDKLGRDQTISSVKPRHLNLLQQVLPQCELTCERGFKIIIVRHCRAISSA